MLLNLFKVAHTNRNPKTRVSFEWTAPSTAGTVEFRYSIDYYKGKLFRQKYNRHY